MHSGVRLASDLPSSPEDVGRRKDQTPSGLLMLLGRPAVRVPRSSGRTLCNWFCQAEVAAITGTRSHDASVYLSVNYAN